MSDDDNGNDDDDDDNDDSALLRAVPAVGRLVWIDVIEKACDAGVNASSRYAKAMDLVIFYFLCTFIIIQYNMSQVSLL